MEFSFEPVTYESLNLIVRWLAKPHVQKWWRMPATLEFVTKKYGGRIDGSEPTAVYIIYNGETPVGMIQSYWNGDYPEHAATINLEKSVGVDLFIGEEAFIGKGNGPRVLKRFVDTVIRFKYVDAQYVVADPEIVNNVSIRAFEKAGFKKGVITDGEFGPEQLMIYTL